MQFQNFLRSRVAKQETVSITTIRRQLKELAERADASPDCSLFISQVAQATAICNSQGRASVSRKTVTLIVRHFGNSELVGLLDAQQREIRSTSGKKIALDNTFKSASSLAAWDPVTQKLWPHRASLLTVAVEEGFVVGAVLVPNDGQEWDRAALLALSGAPPQEGPYHQDVDALLRIGGPLGKFFADVCTDNSMRNKNVLERVAASCAQAQLQRGVSIMYPIGAPAYQSAENPQHALRSTWLDCISVTPVWCADPMPAAHLSDFRFGFSSVDPSRMQPLTLAVLEDLPDSDIARLATVSQDVWHMCNRMERLADRNHPDMPAFKAGVRAAMARCACKSDVYERITGSSPEDVQRKGVREARILQSELLALIDRFRYQIAAASKEQKLSAIVHSVGARVLAEDMPQLQGTAPGAGADAAAAAALAGPAAAPEVAPAPAQTTDLPQPPIPQPASATPAATTADPVFQPRSLPAAARCETISCLVVRPRMLTDCPLVLVLFVAVYHSCRHTFCFCRASPTQALAAVPRMRGNCWRATMSKASFLWSLRLLRCWSLSPSAETATATTARCLPPSRTSLPTCTSSSRS